jgi:carboxypeptidase C (cathepsin A)
MVPIYQELLNGTSGINILVYSGDDDSVCGTIGTQSWIWGMGYEASARTYWSPYVVAEQTAGFLTKWKDTKLGFLTVHGAGHEVPAYKPEVALDLFTRYLKGEFTDGK